MIKAVLFLTVALALLGSAAGNAQPAPLAVPPEQAAGTALMQCVAHTTGQGPIAAKYSQQLATNGVIYTDQPPAYLQDAGQSSVFGKGSFASAPAVEGQVWLVGYDGLGTACMVYVLGAAVQPVEARLSEMFAIPGAWKKEMPVKAEAGERKLQYGWDLKDPKRHLTALVSIRDMSSSPAKGIVVVTISQTTKR